MKKKTVRADLAAATQKNLVYIRKRLRAIGFAILFLLLGSILVGLLIQRKAQDVRVARRLTEQEQELVEKKARTEEISARYSEEYAHLKSLYPNEDTIVFFIDRLEQTAQLSGSEVEFSFERTSPQTDAKGYRYLPYSLRFAADTNGLLVFLERFERLPYLATADEIRVGENSVIIRGKVYVSKPFQT